MASRGDLCVERVSEQWWGPLECRETWGSGMKQREDCDGVRRRAAGLEIHTSLFPRLKKGVRESFEAIHMELRKMEEDTMIKLAQIEGFQREIMLARQPSRDAFADLEENVKKVEKSMESLRAHAANLSHIKLTLARVAGLVSSEGNLAQLVVAPSTSRPTFSSENLTQPVVVPPASRPEPQVTKQSAFAAVVPSGPLVPFSAPLERHLDVQTNPWERCMAGCRSFKSLDTMSAPMTTLPASSSPEQLGDEEASDSYYSTPIGSCEAVSPKRNNNTCFVFYLPATMTNDNLRNLFNQCGTVLNAYVAVDKKTNRPRGFGFVDFASASEAQAAVAKLDKMPLDGKYLSVTIKL